MGWIDVDQSLPTHRKTLEAADDLGIEPVCLVGHLTCFWLWAVDNVDDNSGALPPNIRPRTIARAAMWSGDADMFVDALVSAGFLTRDGSTLAIHDWDDHFGKFAERREKDAERKRAERSADSQRAAADGRRGEKRMSGGRPEDVPRLAQAQTGPNLTGESPRTPESRLDSNAHVSAREGRGPDAPMARAAPDEDLDESDEESIPPQWEEVAQGCHKGNPNGRGVVSMLPSSIEWCPVCREGVPLQEFEAHFAAHAESGEVKPADPADIERFLSGKTLRNRPVRKLIEAQPVENAPPTPEQIAAYEQRRAQLAAARAGPAPADDNHANGRTTSRRRRRPPR